ncbi:hypothetical protein PIB30_036624 [Stylosanthes scabra]|uniref:Uncharacterized protein n=1 Tax=Stylosanthes scabra TaxID=79078 RepID=A0ABU6SE46_9FABA|nr:hypothetical protein [Stylosanthes scabra]
MDYSTNHEVRGIESQGQNSQPPMQQPIADAQQDKQPTAKRNDGSGIKEKEPMISCSVNQPIAYRDLGKEKMQETKEDDEKPKMMKILDDQGRKKILRKPPESPYTVEFPDEDDNTQNMELP